jgi:hypothetical protein
VGVTRGGLALVALGIAAIVAAFLVLHFTGTGGFLLLAAPVALVLGVAAVLLGLRSRPRSAIVVVLGVLLAAFAAWMVVGLTLFILSCNGVIDAGNC